MRGSADRPTLLDEDYRVLFDSIDQGFCVIELIFDAEERPVDYRFLDVNRAFERQTGFSDVLGKLVTEIVPGHDRYWFETYGRIAKTGVAERFVNEATKLGRWYEVYGFRIGEPDSHQVAVLFQDVTERHRVEERDRMIAEQDRFWAALDKAIRPLVDSLEIQSAASKVLGQHLGANRVVYSEVAGDLAVDTADFVDGVDSLDHDPYLLLAYGEGVVEALKGGRTHVIDDIRSLDLDDEERNEYRKDSIQAAIHAPLIKDGRLVALLGVHQAVPRIWNHHEISIVEETAEQTWSTVERARAEAALNASERRLRIATEAADMFNWEIDLGSGTFLASDERRIFGFPIPQTLEAGLAMVHPDDLPRVTQALERAIANGGEARIEYRMVDPDGRGEQWAFTALVVILGDGAGRVVGVTQNITERKQAEQAALESSAFDQFRAKLVDSISSLVDANEIVGEASRVLGQHLGANRVIYAEVEGDDIYASADFVDGVVSMAPFRARFSDYDPKLRTMLEAGQIGITTDIASADLLEQGKAGFLALSIQAYVAVPSIRDGRLVCVFAVHQSVPRAWTDREVALIVETADRIWGTIERAKAETALTASEERLQLAMASTGMGTFVWHPEVDRGEPDAQMLALFGLGPDDKLDLATALERLIHPDDRASYAEAVAVALDPSGGGVLREEIRVFHPDGRMRWLAVHGQTMFEGDPPRPLRMAGTGVDVTDQKVAEGALRESEARHAFLLKLNDILSPFDDPTQIQEAALLALGPYLGVNRAYYAEALPDGDTLVTGPGYFQGVSRPPERIRISDFDEAMAIDFRAGRTVILNDPVTDPSIDEAQRSAYAAMAVRAGLGIPLIKEGRLVGIVGVDQTTPRTWTPAEVSLLRDVAERTWAAAERAKIEKELFRSEEQYRHLFNSMDQGFCVVEMYFDEDGKPVDYLFLETNAVFEQQTGLRGAVGKSARQLVPNLEPHWFDTYGRVAMSGEASRFVEGSEAMGRWFDVYAFRVGLPENRQVAILFTDISERKHAEQASRATSGHNLFRARLADVIGPLVDPIEIQQAVSRFLGEHLNANRVGYAEVVGGECVITVEYSEGVPSLGGQVFRYEDFGPNVAAAIRSGRTLAVRDIRLSGLDKEEAASFESISVRAFVLVTLVKSGEPSLILGVHQKTPREWTNNEIALIEEVAQRTWSASEQARTSEALRASEQRLRLATQAAAIYNWEVDPVAGTFLGSDATDLSFALPETLDTAWAAVHPDDLPGLRKAWNQALEEEGEFSYEYRIRVPEGSNDVWAFSAGKVTPPKGATPLRMVGVTQNITGRKRTEAALRERQAADRDARRRAEFMTAIMSELEATESVTGRARRLVELLVPRVAEFASVVLPGQDDGVVSLGHGDPDIELPLPIGVNMVGTVSLCLGAGRSTSAEDVQFAREIAERAGLLIGNARLQAEEHRIARGLQKALLPIATAQGPELVIAARYEAGSDGLEVGGDWYDSFTLADGRIGLAVGDVVGTGLEAAAAMGRIRTALVALASQTESPAALLTQVDEFVSGPNGSEFATACFATLDPGTGELRYASAAHPPVLMVTPLGVTHWLDGGRSLPLGGGRGPVRTEASMMVEPGSLLVFYSDGLVERRRESLSVGLDRLAKAAEKYWDEPVEILCERIVAELGAGSVGEDDTVIMCVRRVPATAQPFRRTFPARPEELSILRNAVREWLRERQVEVRAGTDLLLALGEACTNAIEHAYRDRPTRDVEVEIREDGAGLRVRVRDFGEWKVPNGTDEKRERGTSIMIKLTRDFRRDTGDDGTVVTFTVPTASEVSM